MASCEPKRGVETGLQSSPTKVEGGRETVYSTDDDVRELLNELIKLVKITNFQLSLLTENTVSKQEVE